MIHPDLERPPAAGMLLIAAPALTDPHFRRTVIYLVAHGADGTVGVVVNRPSETGVDAVLPAWAPHTTRPHIVYAGGPVQTNSAMCLGVCRPEIDARSLDDTIAVTGSVVLIDLDAEPARLVGSLLGMRIYAGRAGWENGQLTEEIEQEAWYVVPGHPTDLLVPAADDLWFTALRRQRWPASLAAYEPFDLERN
ncbi:YqgE/AlgH family protein [Nakamurella flavida]|uniref:UPF0301 protein JL107_10085 n=2 Tax=Nakamurella flavida TaxID=363630 RepID=A0A938YP38_9ACTN|nr:YqgE/AlgH family protein [Nakamurella flavida]